MKFILCCLAAITIIVSCKSKDKKTTGEETVVTENKIKGDSLLLTDSSWGWINASANIAELKSLYGDANVKDDSICGPECADTLAVTIIYPGTNREFIVYWEDSAYHNTISFVRSYTPGALYHSAGGIKIGTTLKELVAMNGKPIAFLGFGWDYGGGIVSMNKGALENSNVHFNIDLAEDVSAPDGVYGDTELNSDMPAVKKLEDKIVVREILVSFNRE